MKVELFRPARRGARLRTAITLCAFAVCVTTASAYSRPSVPANTTIVLAKRHFDLANRDDLAAFIRTAHELSVISKEQRKAEKIEKKGKKRGRDAAEQPARLHIQLRMSGSAAKTDHPQIPPGIGAGGRDWSDKKVRLCLETMERIAEGVQNSVVDRAAGIHDIQEVDWALECSYVTPYVWRSDLDPVSDLFRVRDLTLNACGRGSSAEPASNLLTYTATDLSKVDPQPSSFWSRPASIDHADLYLGFNRKAIPDFTDSVCDYASPHKGYGIHPSFEITWHKKTWKVKFGEERSSGPFACRIFWALGFPAEIVDYTPRISVRWDRRILADFNSRQSNTIKIKLLGLPIETLHENCYFDPFDFITSAVLKDGTRIDPLKLREQLFPVGPGVERPKHPELTPSLYDKAFEGQIDYLVMKDASVVSKEHDGVEELGFWDYNSAGNPMRREVRAMGVLNAWLDNWDIRWGNNRLNLVTNSDGSYKLVHVVSDLGALFGNSSGFIRRVHGKVRIGQYQNAPNDYTWAFTHGQKRGQTSVPIQDYMPVTKTWPFYRMNLDDARWMARSIAQLSEVQIKQGLIAAGFDAAEARLLLEKLVARRDKMVNDFGLSGEISPLRPGGVDRKLTYDPGANSPFVVSHGAGLSVTARYSGEYVVIGGSLRARPRSVPAVVARDRQAVDAR